jgi:hypothetical protein
LRISLGRATRRGCGLVSRVGSRGRRRLRGRRRTRCRGRGATAARSIITLSKDLVLSTISETPLIEVVGGIVLVVEHVVALCLEPVQRLLSTLVTLGNITSAPDGNLRLENGGV